MVLCCITYFLIRNNPCFENVIFKNRSKITYCSYDYQTKSEDYFYFFEFRIVLNKIEVSIFEKKRNLKDLRKLFVKSFV